MDSEAERLPATRVSYRWLSAADVRVHLCELTDVLVDCVEGGASIGFMRPLERSRAQSFWMSVASDVAAGSRRIIVAASDDAIVGSVQLITGLPENQPHRAEIAKMIVRRHARGLGIGRELMVRAEGTARECGRTLLVLDTANPIAERLYASLGWQRVGAIPNFALMPDGALTSTTFMYRDLRA